MCAEAARDYRFRVVRPFAALRTDRRRHFVLMQVVGFVYAAYRLLSRDYAAYGLLPEDAFDYAAAQTVQIEIWPFPLLHLLSGQFLYHWLPHPSVAVITGMQIGGAVACGLGLLGVLPRLAAAAAFFVMLHLTGLMQATNSMIDGGSLAMTLLLILALAPSANFSRLGRRTPSDQASVEYRWPVFVLFLFVGAFYVTAGLNKVIHDGPHWPFIAHLENLARIGLERSVFVASRYSCPGVSWLMDDAGLAVVSAFIALAAELLFIGILWWPRLRLSLVVSMVVMHVLVFDMQGINFLGSSFILLLCLDWNAPCRKLEVAVTSRHGFATRLFETLARARPDRVSALAPTTVRDQALRERGIIARDETGEAFGGVEALDQMLLRRPVLWPLAAFFRIPGVAWGIDRLFFRAG